MAIRLTKAFGSTPETWLRMQLAYDLAAALKNERRIKVRRVRVSKTIELSPRGKVRLGTMRGRIRLLPGWDAPIDLDAFLDGR